MGVAIAFGCNTASETGSSGDWFSDSDILVARSMDTGITWTAPAALNVDADTDFGADEAPQLTTDNQGVWLAVWQSTSFDPLVREDFDLLVSHSADDGATWMDQAELNSDAATDAAADGDISPQLTTDGAGNWVAVWSSAAGYNRPPPVIADYDILVARSTDDGATWTAQAPLNTNAAGDDGNDEAPQVTTDGAGTWLAVWNSNEGYNLSCETLVCRPGETPPTDHDILFSRSTDGGATWSASAALNTSAATDSSKAPARDGGNDKHPQVATDGAGTWVAVWESDQDYNRTQFPRGKDYDILVARSADGGMTWTAQVALNANAADDETNEDDILPQLTTDGQGVWVAVWESVGSLGGTIGADADILFARSTDGGATWTAPAALNTNAASDDGQDKAPQLTTDGQGTWVAVWESDDALDGTLGADADILFARSTDDAVTWTAPAALNTNAASEDPGGDHLPQLTTDGQGAWVAVWQSMESL